MREGKPSQTAAWVAAARSLGQALPEAERLVLDPYGVAFLTGPLRVVTEQMLARPALLAFAMARSRALRSIVWWMQLRTRAIDDTLREFIASGGRQVLLLGAGHDCRAVRLAHLLEEASVFEVDHPSTQSHKRHVVREAALESPARYVAWDFERDGLSGLLPRLSEEGLSHSHRVLTIWEGVTNYLSESAVAGTFDLLGRLGAAGSWLAFTYMDRSALAGPKGGEKLMQRLVALVGEPFRFGWDPAALPAWLAEHQYLRLSDHADAELARRHLTPAAVQHFGAALRHVAVARSERIRP